MRLYTGSDPEAFWLGPSRSACSQNWAGSHMPHPTFRIRFGSIFAKKALNIIIVQNRPGSDLDGLVRFWPNASGPEASRCSRIIGPGTGRTQPARYQFHTFRLGSVLPQTARIHCVQTIPDPIWFWLTVSGFGQTDPVRKQVGVRESSGPLPIGFGSDRNQIRQVYWVIYNYLFRLNRTALEKGTHLYDDTQRTIQSTSAFDIWSSPGVEERWKIMKEEGLIFYFLSIYIIYIIIIFCLSSTPDEARPMFRKRLCFKLFFMCHRIGEYTFL